MPTLIDSLVVSLLLDATQFNEQQRRAIESLRDFEGRARRSAGQAQESVGQTITTYARALGAPMTAMRRQFEMWASSARRPQQALRDIADESRRTGEEVERGALRGSTALIAFGTAGVAAFAAYEALTKITAAVNRTAGGVFSTGIGALGAGTNINEFGAIAQALNVIGNIPTQDAQAVMTKLGQMRAQYTMNPDALNSLVTTFAQAGITNLPIFNPMSGHYVEDLLTQLAADLSAMSPDKQKFAIQQLSSIFPPEMLTALASGRLPAEIARQRQNAPTGEQLDQTKSLLQAENDLAQAFSRLEREILFKFVPAMEAIARFINRLVGPTKHPDESKWIGNEPAPPGSHWETKVDPETGETYHEIAPGAPGPGKPAQREPRSVFRQAWDWLTGSGPVASAPIPPPPGGTGAPVPPPPPGGSPGDPRNMIPGLRAAAIANGLNPDDVVALARAEGLTSKFKSWDVNGWSYGALQMHTPGMADEYRKATGRDPTNPANEADMNAWAVAYIARHGTNGKWSAVNNGLVREPRRIATQVATETPANQSRIGLEPHQVTPNLYWDGHMLRRIQADAASAGAVTNNNGGNTNLSGVNITVNAPLREGSAIADAIHRQLQDASLAGNSNTGLQ